MLEELKYPIGKFSFQQDASDEQIKSWKQDIKELPVHLANAVSGLNDEQLDQTYREGGWTLRQVVHHLADSHLHAYARIKFALTEDKPTIKPYDENAWAELVDSVRMPVETSLKLLEGLHARWSLVNDNINPDDELRTVFHPESNKHVSIRYFLALYAWHGKHHAAHITSTRQRNNW